jgi:transposase
LGVSVEVVRKPKKPLPEKVAKVWAEEWAKEGKEVNWQRLMPPRGFRVLPRRWVVERTFSRGSATTGGWPRTTRGVGRHRRGVCLRGDDAANGEALGPCVGLSRQSLHALGWIRVWVYPPESWPKVRSTFTRYVPSALPLA